jgi:hypothetical protein
MLADILKNNFDHSHLDQIEEFQNNFINEEQVTNDLRKAIIELQKQSSKILDDPVQKEGFDEKMKKFDEELKQSDLRFQSMVASFLSFRNQING